MRLPLLPVILVLSLASAYSMPPVDSGPTHHSGQIDTNEVWLPSGNPHILDGDVWAGDSVTLTIMPGCTLRFAANAELYAGYARPGSIVAVGTADSVIAFTSSSTAPEPGDWWGVGIYGLAGNDTRFSYCDFSYAGADDNHGTIYVSEATVAISHCRISQSADYGVKADGRAAFSLFADNTITSCAKCPLSIMPECAGMLDSGNVLTGNASDGILISGETVSRSATWLDHGVPYVISDDVAVEDATNAPVLTIAPGATIAFKRAVELYVGYNAPGGLVADGTAGQVTFTSSSLPPSRGDWYGVTFYRHSTSSQCRIINCKIEYAGSRYNGDIQVEDCVPTIEGCDIGYSSAYGIYLDGTQYPAPDTLRARNTFHDNDSGDIRVPGSGIEEPPSVGGLSRAHLPTIVEGMLKLGATDGWNATRGAELVDVTGRSVLELTPGLNDVRHLSPGIYFVCGNSTERRSRIAVFR